MAYETWDQKRTFRYYAVRQYRRLIWLTMFSFALSIALILLSVYFYLTWPSQRYFASNAEFSGSIIELRPLSRPNSNDNALLRPDMPPEIIVKNVATPPPVTTPQDDSATQDGVATQ